MDVREVFLPGDIIREILKRVPVKSLTRFQSVAKDWKNLFKTPTFIADHLHHFNHNHSFLLLQRIHRINFLSQPLRLCLHDSQMEVLEVQNTPFINSMKGSMIVGSCNGLLCIRHKDGGFPERISLWNPATREVRQVPRTICDFNGICNLGFGFSPIVNDYKIVRIYVPDFADENGVLVLDEIFVNRVEVYSLSTGSWKDIEFGNLQTVRPITESVNVNGAMFWYGLNMGVDEDSDLIVSFDIAQEVFTQTKMPASASNPNGNKLTVYKNKLALLSHFIIGNFESSLIDLWVMEGTCATGEHWTKQYTIGPFSSILYPLSIWRNEIVCKVERPGLIGETESEVNGVKTVLSLFNPTINELKNLPTHGYEHRYAIFNYAESLVPIANIHVEE